MGACYQNFHSKEICMKKFVKLFVIIALAAVIGFSMAACGGDDDGGPGPTGGGDNTGGNSGGDNSSGSGTVTLQEGSGEARTVTWRNALSAISSGGNDKSYTITVSGNVSVGSRSYSFGMGTTGITVTLKGSGTVSLSSQGCLLDVRDGQTLIIDSDELTLRGRADNVAPVIKVEATQSNCTLELKAGTIRGNTNRSGGGISDCVSGGVHVRGGTFVMSGGTISGNSAAHNRNGYGGGVYVENGTSGYGPAIPGTFTMSGGIIRGNSAAGRGGGVFVRLGGTFTKSGGGIIYGKDEGANSNKAGPWDRFGDAVYAGDGYRNTTLGESDNISTDSSAGWEW
jgi:hypothetical protein